MAVFFLTNAIVLSALGHKEMRFITNIILIGQIAQGYMITYLFDARHFILESMEGSTYRSSVASLLGTGIKWFALYVVFV